MASNSSAAFFGIRDGDQQDQIKPLISPQQQQQHLAAALPGAPSNAPASGQSAPAAAAAQPPPKKKRTLPGDSSRKYHPFSRFRPCMHTAYMPAARSRLDPLEFYDLEAGSRSISFSHMCTLGFSFHFSVCLWLIPCLYFLLLVLDLDLLLCELHTT